MQDEVLQNIIDFFTDDSSEYSMDNFDHFSDTSFESSGDSCDEVDLTGQLAGWVTKYNISYSAVHELLQILGRYHDFLLKIREHCCVPIEYML